MVNPTDPSIGWGCEFHLSTDDTEANLKELDQVFNMGLPNDQADRVEVTHYKSPQRRKQYIQGLFDAGTFTVEMNYEPGSDTDVLIRAAKDAGDSRAFKQVVLDADDGEWEISGTLRVLGYERAVPNGDRKTATMTATLDGAVTEALAA